MTTDASFGNVMAGSMGPTTISCSPNRAVSVPSVATPRPGVDDSASTMTTRLGTLGGFSVQDATLDLGNLMTARLSFGQALDTSTHPSSVRFYQLIAEAARLHSVKQKDYGRTEDPFANVRASVEWGMPPWVGAMVRATDKLRRLQRLAQGGTLANEGAMDSFLDLAVYSLIAAVLYEESQ